MDIGSKGFSDLLKHEVGRMAASMKLEPTDPLFAFLRMAKITEEVGELSDCLQGEFGFLRAQKQEKYSRQELEHEMADVLISTMLLGAILDIDISKAVQEKLDIIMERPYAGEHTFSSECRDCGKTIHCVIGSNKGIIENKDFHLHGGFTLCGDCDEKNRKAFEL